MGKNVTHLLSYFAPQHYDLGLDLNKQDMTFSGEVTIQGKKVGRPSKRFTLHQKGLRVATATITKIDKDQRIDVPVSRIVHQNSYDEVRLHSDEQLYPGTYELTLTFSGDITPQMNGVYPSDFTHEGTKKQLLATQFESHHAREVFPCIDEPAAKATFSLELITGAGEEVVSNTPVLEQTTHGSRCVTTFEKTPIMSTYLLAFVVGDMDYKQTQSSTGVTIRAYSTPANVDYLDFALEVARGCIEFYDNYFAIPYPLNKCDLIALPDFASGAMENWGCITFREQTLLVDPAHTTLSTKQYVAMVVAHELAHQWFGNLVTMRWWTDLWLNEGFASWVEYLAVNELFPDWEMWTQFTSSEQQQALRLDALKHTHPIEVPVNDPEEIRTIFDTISYSKGASAIHMLHQYLGPDDFRVGLQHYLKTHAYGNTDTVDLWQALEDSSHKPVRAFMHDWTSQSGFPVVEADVQLPQVNLTQQRFMTQPEAGKADKTLWPIPLLLPATVGTETLDTYSTTLDYTDDTVFKLNRGQSGFYRTVYNASHLQTLGTYVKKSKLPALDRIGILSDAFEAAKYGYRDTPEALALLENFFAEDNFAVWEVISSWIGSLRLVMNDEELRESMKPFVRSLVAEQLERLGWERRDSDSHFDQLLRPIIIGMAASADEQWVVDRCWDVFEHIENIEDMRPDLTAPTGKKQVKRGLLHPDLRGAVFGTVAKRGDRQTFDKLVRLHNSAHLSEEKTTLASAITGFRQPELISESLDLITSSHVRLQDVSYWVAYSFMNRHAKQQTWDWLKENWEWLDENFSSDLSFYRMPLYVARAFSDKKFHPEFEEFFTRRMSTGLERSYNQALEMLEWQAAWKKRSLDTTKHFFTSKYHQ